MLLRWEWLGAQAFQACSYAGLKGNCPAYCRAVRSRPEPHDLIEPVLRCSPRSRAPRHRGHS